MVDGLSLSSLFIGFQKKVLCLVLRFQKKKEIGGQSQKMESERKSISIKKEQWPNILFLNWFFLEKVCWSVFHFLRKTQKKHKISERLDQGKKKKKGKRIRKESLLFGNFKKKSMIGSKCISFLLGFQRGRVVINHFLVSDFLVSINFWILLFFSFFFFSENKIKKN